MVKVKYTSEMKNKNKRGSLQSTFISTAMQLLPLGLPEIKKDLVSKHTFNLYRVLEISKGLRGNYQTTMISGYGFRISSI